MLSFLEYIKSLTTKAKRTPFMLKLFSPQSFPILCAPTAQIGIQIPLQMTQKPAPTWQRLCAPLKGICNNIQPIPSTGNHPIEFTFLDQLYSLIYFHVEEYDSARALFEDLNDPQLSGLEGLPCGTIRRSTFSDAINTRGLPQMLAVFHRLSHKAGKLVGDKYPELGQLNVHDGSLIEATLSMEWADYTNTTNKAKAHLTFHLNSGMPTQISLTDGKGPERPVADYQLESGQTGVISRGYQDHRRFDDWQASLKHFVCRIRRNTTYTLCEQLPIPAGTNIVFHAIVHLGDDAHRTRYPVRLIGVRKGRTTLWIATSRFDLTAEQIATIYRLRWQIETFFAWWKRHLNVYHLIARSHHGVFMQLLAGLISYLLLVIYCFGRDGACPSLTHLRHLRRRLRQERASVVSSTGFVVFCGIVFMIAQWELTSPFGLYACPKVE